MSLTGGEMLKIALIKGDGIGPEVTASAKRVLQTLIKEIELIEIGAEIDDKAFDIMAQTRLVLKGPITTPIGEGFRSLNVMLRKKYDLYCNIRPALSLPGVPTRYEDVDLVIFRENTEDLYAGIERRIDDDHRESIKVITRKGSERIIKAAFEYAKDKGRKKVTLVHKANIMKETDGLFLHVGREIAAAYPEIQFEEIIVDNMCMQLVTDPCQFDVIVTMNLYGDIISDLCAGLVGGLGVTPGANIGEGFAIFEPVHGSAPDIAGKNVANPLAILLSSALLLDYVERHEEANMLRKVLKEVVMEEAYHTADIGGTCTTTAFTDAVCGMIERLSDGKDAID